MLRRELIGRETRASATALLPYLRLEGGQGNSPKCVHKGMSVPMDQLDQGGELSSRHQKEWAKCELWISQIPAMLPENWKLVSFWSLAIWTNYLHLFIYLPITKSGKICCSGIIESVTRELKHVKLYLPSQLLTGGIHTSCLWVIIPKDVVHGGVFAEGWIYLLCSPEPHLACVTYLFL